MQESLVTGFSHSTDAKLVDETGSVALPHFSDIARMFRTNYTIFTGVLDLFAKARMELVTGEVALQILDHQVALATDPAMLTKAVEILATKIHPPLIPIEILTLMESALSTLISNNAVIKQVLTVCYYAVSAPRNTVPHAAKLISRLSAVLCLRENDPSLVRRAAAIVRSLSVNTDNDVALSQTGIAFSLLRAASSKSKDKSTVGTILSALANFLPENKVVSAQIDTKAH
jgi:hypothetical protein